MTRNRPKPTWKAWTTVNGDIETIHVMRATGRAEIHLTSQMPEGSDLGQTILALISQVKKFADENPKTVGSHDDHVEVYLRAAP